MAHAVRLVATHKGVGRKFSRKGLQGRALTPSHFSNSGGGAQSRFLVASMVRRKAFFGPGAMALPCLCLPTTMVKHYVRTAVNRAYSMRGEATSLIESFSSSHTVRCQASLKLLENVPLACWMRGGHCKMLLKPLGAVKDSAIATASSGRRLDKRPTSKR